MGLSIFLFVGGNISFPALGLLRDFLVDNDDKDDSGVDGVAADSVGVTTDDTDGVSEGEEMVGSDEIVGVAGSGSGTVSRTRLLRKPDFSTISDLTSTAIYFSNTYFFTTIIFF